jgi:hypothetical protein
MNDEWLAKDCRRAEALAQVYNSIAADDNVLPACRPRRW